MDDQEPISSYEVQQLRKWKHQWNALRFLALATRKLILWVAAAGVALSVWWDILQNLIGAGVRK